MAEPEIVEEVFEGHRLKEKVAVRGVGRGIDLGAIARAEKALTELSSNFDDWTAEEVERLRVARDAVTEHGYAGDYAEDLFRVAHDLKGQAVTFGYPMVTRIAASLCMLLELAEQGVAPPLPLVNHHVDAIRAIVRDQVKGESNATAITLFNNLAAVTNDFVEAHRPPRPAGTAG